MIEPGPTSDETRRLSTLHALGLLDTPAEERFDRITRLAQRLFGTPIALISLVDEDRQWFKSRQGIDDPETPRSVSFCGHAIHGDDPLVVTDTLEDARFADNPLVVGDPAVRFYAGCPIAGPDGSKLGTLCVIDREPRHLDDTDVVLLRDLAKMVETEIAAVDTAITDELTGLVNRRGFHLIATKVLALCQSRSLPAVMVYVDLDNLKPINDRFGHDAGDQAIVAAARLLSNAFRASDVVARVGGDEFVVLLSGAGDPNPALERLARSIVEHNTAAGWELSLSAGCALFDPESPLDLEDLTRRADQAMYREKLSRGASTPSEREPAGTSVPAGKRAAGNPLEIGPRGATLASGWG